MAESSRSSPGSGPPAPVDLPADLDLEDRLVGVLTTRQVLLLCGAGALLYAAYTLTRAVVPVVVFALVAVPLAAGCVALVLGRRDGVALERYLVHAVAHLHATQPIPATSGRGNGSATGWGPDPGRGGGPGGWWTRPRLPRRAWVLPPRGVADTPSGLGVVDLGAAGLAVIAVIGAVSMTLRSPAEQQALLGTFARWCHSLSTPTQILIRALPLDLSERVRELEEATTWLPHPDLRAAAGEHADFLDQLAADHELLHRHIVLVLREPVTTMPGSNAGQARRDRAALTRLSRRLADAAELLAPAGITVTPLNAEQATALLHAACHTPASATTDLTATSAGSALMSADEADPAPHDRSDRVGGPPDTADWGWYPLPHQAHPQHANPAQESAPLDGERFGPARVQVGARVVSTEAGMFTVLALTGWPAEVYPGWLDPLLSYPGRVDVSLHLEPVEPLNAAERLRKRQGRLEAARRHSHAHARLPDPLVEAAAADAAELAGRVARGESRLFRLAIYLCVHAPDPGTLADEVAAVRAVAASMMCQLRPVSYRHTDGWQACLPLGVDGLGIARTLDTSPLAAAFPFASNDLPGPDPTSPEVPPGVLHGFNLGSSGLVFHDDWSCENYNSVTLGPSGSGKSYATKLRVLRSLYRGVTVQVIDPEDEYTRLTHAVGGHVIRLGSPGTRLNPCALPIHTSPEGTSHAPADAVTRRQLFLHTVLAVLLGSEPGPAVRAVWDEAITTAYQRAGIHADQPATWTRPPPHLADLAAALAQHPNPAAGELAAQLRPYTHGAHATVFTQPTHTGGGVTEGPPHLADVGGHVGGHLVSWSLRALPAELRGIGTLLVLDRIAAQLAVPVDQRPRLVVIDEAWLLMAQPSAAAYVWRLAKSARKHNAGLAFVSQDIADVLGSPLGQAIIGNAATTWLFRAKPQTIRELARIYDLTDGEQTFLLRAQTGEALLTTPARRVAVRVVASPSEHDLVTTDPKFLATLQDSERNSGWVELS